MCVWMDHDQEKFDQPFWGIPSVGAYQMCRVLFSDQIFYQSLEHVKTYERAKTLVTHTLNRITRNDLVFFPMEEQYIRQAAIETLNKAEEIRAGRPKAIA